MHTYFDVMFCFQEAVKESKAALLTPEDGEEVSLVVSLLVFCMLFYY